MILTIYTIIHVIISLVAIASGLAVLAALLKSKYQAGMTKLFLWTTVATSVTGFFFPVHQFLPSHAVGILSLVLLAAAIYALNSKRLAGGWRKIYVVTAMLSLYLNVFVLIVQSFLKVSALHALAPTQNEPPFKITQLVVLVIFIGLIVVAAIKFKDGPERTV